jgi:hypothetical protein
MSALSGVVLALLLSGVAQGDGWERHISRSCAITVLLPRGWSTRPAEVGGQISCGLELRPPHWRPDPECPEGYHGRLFIYTASKPSRAPRDDLGGVRPAPWCESGWYGASPEGGACLSAIKGKPSALIGYVGERLYCHDKYGGVGQGLTAVVFGDKRRAYWGGLGPQDQGQVERIIASLRFVE